ncbi:YciI family protein [Streptomyces sp. NPDC059909]|uniref:YciI family protein n=1 Tax=Streptomyces sp. NPDC059909 TaxID=3346998 RepID=UPI00364B6CDF
MKPFVVTLAFADGIPGKEVSEAQQAFLAKLHNEGTLMLSGPFNDGAGGMAILRCDSLEQARNIYQESPVIRSGVATADVREWNVVWGSIQR